MHAYRIYEFGGPESLKRDELPAPGPGPGQVLIKVKAVSLNYRDLLISKGLYNPKLALPRIPLSDGAGEVTALGPGATRFKPGDRVAGCFMPAWTAGSIGDSKAPSTLGSEIDGTLAEEIVLPEEGLVSIPEHLSFEEAATLPCAAVTAWHALVDSGGIKPGETVLTLGTGGVSIFALQFAKMAGAQVIATSGHDDKLSRLREMGASEVINYKTTPEWDRQVLSLTAGRGVDHVVEVGGAGTLNRSIRAVRRGGHIALIGVLSGLGDVNPMPILMKAVRVQGIYVGSRTMFEAMNRAITVSQLRPVIDRVFEFQDAIAALKHLESGSHFGKVVVRV